MSLFSKKEDRFNSPFFKEHERRFAQETRQFNLEFKIMQIFVFGFIFLIMACMIAYVTVSVTVLSSLDWSQGLKGVLFHIWNGVPISK